MGALVLIDGSPFDWLGTGTPRAPARRHRRRHQHRPRPPLPARRGPAWLSHPAPAAGRAARPARDPLRRSPRRLRPQRCRTGGSRKSSRAPSIPPSSARSCGTSASATSPPHSPQAKGRIERLWATLQDRLVAELRLRGDPHRGRGRGLPARPISPTTTAASPSPPPSPWPPGAGRPAISPTGSAAATPASWPATTPSASARGWVQIPRGPHGRSYAGCRVEVRECLDGRLLVDYQGRRLVTAAAPAGDFVLVPRRAQRLRASQERVRGGGPPSPPWPKRPIFGRSRRSRPWPSTYAVRHARIPGGRPSRAANANASRQETLTT